jgi:hypothetical protein
VRCIARRRHLEDNRLIAFEGERCVVDGRYRHFPQTTLIRLDFASAMRRLTEILADRFQPVSNDARPAKA